MMGYVKEAQQPSGRLPIAKAGRLRTTKWGAGGTNVGL